MLAGEHRRVGPRAQREASRIMNTKSRDVTQQLLKQVRHSLAEHHLPRITRCMALLSQEDIWWRPNRASNSVGNLVLHLAGNVRQWIISGVGGAVDTRERDKEFAARGAVPRLKLIADLRRTVTEAAQVIEGLTEEDLEGEHAIQGFRVTGLQAIFHVAEHFAFHSGQIQFVTKLKRGEDLGFTRLPGERVRAKAKAAKLPQI
jgi:uncharacterized damage-inducible protein DinB